MQSKREISRLLAVSLLAFSLSGVAWSEGRAPMKTLPNVGDTILTSNLPRDERGVCQISPGQIDKCAETTIGAIRYRIAFRAKPKAGGWVCTSVHTVDKRFEVNRLRVGDFITVNDANELIPTLGFEIYAPRQDHGWWPVVGFNGTVEILQEDGVSKSLALSDLSPTEKKGRLRVLIVGFARR